MAAGRQRGHDAVVDPASDVEHGHGAVDADADEPDLAPRPVDGPEPGPQQLRHRRAPAHHAEADRGARAGVAGVDQLAGTGQPPAAASAAGHLGAQVDPDRGREDQAAAGADVPVGLVVAVHVGRPSARGAADETDEEDDREQCDGSPPGERTHAATVGHLVHPGSPGGRAVDSSEAEVGPGPSAGVAGAHPVERVPHEVADLVVLDEEAVVAVGGPQGGAAPRRPGSGRPAPAGAGPGRAGRSSCR